MDAYQKLSILSCWSLVSLADRIVLTIHSHATASRLVVMEVSSTLKSPTKWSAK